ncbi:hypothetical protein AQUCO_00800012v1 [Aquilegia coerulea]|uniref:Myosin motor domain-containing protein n=1 Tax=Aquilegia coerulea TaxID=218851 RepID=A0A2G5EGT5_AQUCA|nr:hypothetical protein AQUCO_00800012v1 [Aquilegia coerulea]
MEVWKDRISLNRGFSSYAFRWQFPRGNILPANPDYLEGNDDLIRLSFLNEPSVLHNLQTRYYDDQIYTKAGRILVAINPFNDVHFHENEFRTRKKLMYPLVHAIAESTFNEMMRGEENQSIILSGQSGAGKTKTASIVIEYLASLGGHNDMQHKLLQANLILEAFGNAKTFMNHNSSRFGKLIEIHFNSTGEICGAQIETLLLEKSRVAHLSKGERSYHIFYQLCSGAPSHLKEKFNLKSSREFDYLKQSGCLTIDAVDDAQKFHTLVEALDVVQISREDQENAFAMLSAILWLGNISFQIIDSENHVEVIADEAVASASKLLGCDVHDLMLLLSTHHIQAGNNSVTQKLSSEQAIGMRNTLAKSIYASLFDWLLERINMSLKIDQQKAWRSISIVDIYGFESFQRNSFEQFCINYANERLQQYFKRHIFKLEQEEYNREGIDWTRVDFNDNQECLNLFEQKPYGLLLLLDEESKSVHATDLTLVNKLKHHLSSNPCFKGEKDGFFSVLHYAGEVLYGKSGFLEKNIDSMHSAAIQLLSSCTYELPQLFASNLLKPSQMHMSPLLSLGATGFQKQSVGMKFKDQLFKLLQQLETTKPHFICCIKPNNKQLPNMFEKDLVLQQLRSSGVLEVVKISRSGYPTQMTHQQFARRYGLLRLDHETSQKPLSLSVAILDQFNIHPDTYQVGYTKLFFRSGQVATLEDARNRMLQGIVKVQKCIRGHLARCHFLELAKRITSVQSDQTKSARKEKQVSTKRLSTVPLTNMCMKQDNEREASNDRERAVILLQSVIRGWLARKRFDNMRNLNKSKFYIANGHSQPNKSIPELKEHSQAPASVVRELKRQVLKADALVKQKESENAVLQQQLKQLQIRLAEHDSRTRSMEETWQKQMTALQMNLAAAKNSLAGNDNVGRTRRPDASTLPHSYGSEELMPVGTHASEPCTPAKLTNCISDATPRREPNGGLNSVSHLVKELEQQKQVFNNDVRLLVEVKTGQSASTLNSYGELQKVKQNFEAWKKEFKVKLKNTKSTLKHANSETEKTHWSWWRKRSSRRS